MAIENERIRIDPEALASAAGALSAIGERLDGDASRLGSARVDVRSFGLMNAWLVPPISALAGEAAETVAASGRLATALGAAAAGAVDDFDATEQRIIDGLRRLEEGIE